MDQETRIIAEAMKAVRPDQRKWDRLRGNRIIHAEVHPIYGDYKCLHDWEVDWNRALERVALALGNGDLVEFEAAAGGRCGV